MGITMRLAAVTDQKIRELHNDPSGCLDALGLGAASMPSGALLDLDKSWHALHFLLTGEAMEVQKADGNADAYVLISGGTPLDDDTGFGPPRTLASAEVRRWDKWLRTQTDDVLRAAYQPGEMEEADVYGSFNGGDDELE